MSVETIGVDAGHAALAEVHELGGERVCFSATSDDIVAAVQTIFRRPVMRLPASSATTIVEARSEHGGWQLETDGEVVRSLDSRTPIPRIAEEMVAIGCSAVAKKQAYIVATGAFLEKDGAAIALVGDDVAEAKILGFHLHDRGWSAISIGIAFVCGMSLEIVGLQALTSISSSCIDRIPSRYRPAVEASRWYYSGFDLAFYTVDPLSITPQSAAAALLTHVVYVGGDHENTPSLTIDVNPLDIGPLGVHPKVNSLRIARLTLGTPIASCSAIERWVADSRYVSSSASRCALPHVKLS